MQNKYKKHLLFTGFFVFLLLQNLSAQAIKKESESNGSKEEKTNSYSEVVTLLNSQTSSVQSSAGGDVQSTSFNNTATAGQPGPVGISSSTSYNNNMGFIPTLLYGEIDVTAPPPPIMINVNGYSPSLWQNDSTFMIDWINPPDISGIDMALYKLGIPPAFNYDTTGSLPPDSGIVYTTVENGQNLFLWLVDGRGNTNFDSVSVMLLRYDASGPSGTMASSPDTSINESFEVSWSSGDDAIHHP